jgi:hypothetical protein
MLKLLASFLQKLIDIAGTSLSFIVDLLPQSPFSLAQSSQFSDLLADINYFVPIYEFIAIGQAWLIAIAAYYLYSVFARWIKMIQ